MFLVLAGYEVKEFGIKLLMSHNYKMNSRVETKDLLSLHSCANIKEEISEWDATISGDPLYIRGSQNDIKIKEEIDPLSKVSEMINEGNVELTKTIDIVHQYNLEVHEGNKLDIKRELVIKTENVHEEENSMVTNPIIKEEVSEFEEIEIDPLSLCETVEERKIIKRKESISKEIVRNKRGPSYKVDYKSSASAKRLGECLKCHVSFHEIDEYIRHTNQCVYERQNICSHCGENFATNRRLSVHLELMHEEKKEVIIEAPKIKKQKIDRFVLPVLPLPNPSEPFSKRQIFDYLYSRKITPGQSRVCEYEKHFLETVLILKEVTIEKLSEISVKKLESKVRSFTQWLFTNWKKRGKHWIYRRFQKKDSFDWIPELKENV